jgi:hypothetical protein
MEAQPESAKGKSAAGGATDNSGAAVADKDFTKFRRFVISNLSDEVRSASILSSANANVVDRRDLCDDICDHERLY